jgi:DNA-binding GntR family transcriptional regulator
MKSPKQKHKNGSERVRGSNSGIVAEQLRNKILRLELRPGEAIDEVSLAAEFGVSRTPMREALIRLAGENLVELTPNRGARVTTLNLPDIRELFEVLEVVQGVTTRWAALRRADHEIAEIQRAVALFRNHIANNELLAAVQSNFDLHVRIASASRNKLLAAYYSNLLSRTFRLGVLTFDYEHKTDRERRKDLRLIENDHKSLVRAIADRNGPVAEQIARRHARDFLLRVTRYMDENLGQEVGSYDPHFSVGEAS